MFWMPSSTPLKWRLPLTGRPLSGRRHDVQGLQRQSPRMPFQMRTVQSVPGGLRQTEGGEGQRERAFLTQGKGSGEGAQEKKIKSAPSPVATGTRLRYKRYLYLSVPPRIPEKED